MADAIATLVKLAPGLVNLATSLVGTADAANRNAQLIEFQSAIIQFQSVIATVQADNASLVSQKRDLEKELERVKAWEEQKQRYKLMPAWDGSGFVVYSLKESCKGAEPPHWLCTKCYDDGRRSMFYPTKDKTGYTLLHCPTCNASINTGYRGIPQPTYAQD